MRCDALQNDGRRNSGGEKWLSKLCYYSILVASQNWIHWCHMDSFTDVFTRKHFILMVPLDFSVDYLQLYVN